MSLHERSSTLARELQIAHVGDGSAAGSAARIGTAGIGENISVLGLEAPPEGSALVPVDLERGRWRLPSLMASILRGWSPFRRFLPRGEEATLIEAVRYLRLRLKTRLQVVGIGHVPLPGQGAEAGRRITHGSREIYPRLRRGAAQRQTGKECGFQSPGTPLPVAGRFVKAFLLDSRSVGAIIHTDAECTAARDKLPRGNRTLRAEAAGRPVGSASPRVESKGSSSVRPLHS